MKLGEYHNLSRLFIPTLDFSSTERKPATLLRQKPPMCAEFPRIEASEGHNLRGCFRICGRSISVLHFLLKINSLHLPSKRLMQDGDIFSYPPDCFVSTHTFYSLADFHCSEITRKKKGVNCNPRFRSLTLSRV